jgi:hypothetical protein
MSDQQTPPPNEGWVPSGTCGGRWSRVVNGIFETWRPLPVPGVTIAGGGAIYTTTPSDALLVVANSEIASLTATIERVRALVNDWGAGTVHRPRNPYYTRLRAALEEDER